VNKTAWDIVLHNWPITLFVPAVLVIIAVLATITRATDDD
jgi:hypothetical protein